MADPKKVKQGDLMAITTYVKVEKVSKGGELLAVRDVESGTQFDINGKPLVEKMGSADQYTEVKKLTKTAAAELLITKFNTPITVRFIKQGDPVTINGVKYHKDGEARVLRGKIVGIEPLLGRTQFIDLDITSGHPLRLVDHRTIEWFIVDNVKYEVKK